LGIPTEIHADLALGLASQESGYGGVSDLRGQLALGQTKLSIDHDDLLELLDGHEIDAGRGLADGRLCALTTAISGWNKQAKRRL